jgi:hypothetical protein
MRCFELEVPSELDPILSAELPGGSTAALVSGTL